MLRARSRFQSRTADDLQSATILKWMFKERQGIQDTAQSLRLRISRHEPTQTT